MNRIVQNNKDKLLVNSFPNEGKETVILLHGGPGFPSDMDEVCEMLKGNYQVISFHQRGTKLSPCESKDYSMQAYISDIECIASAFELDKFHLWGHSWGGLYAQIYADKYSEKLKSLFLCCPGSGTGKEWLQTEKEVMQLNQSKCSFWEWTKMGVNMLMGMMGSDDAYKRMYKQVLLNYNRGFTNQSELGIDFDNLKAEPVNRTRQEIVKYPELQKDTQFSIPTTIVYGDQDIYKSSKNYVLNRYPKATVDIIPNCGHIPWLHNAEAYSLILKRHYNL